MLIEKLFKYVYRTYQLEYWGHEFGSENEAFKYGIRAFNSFTKSVLEVTLLFPAMILAVIHKRYKRRELWAVEEELANFNTENEQEDGDDKEESESEEEDDESEDKDDGEGKPEADLEKGESYSNTIAPAPTKEGERKRLERQLKNILKRINGSIDDVAVADYIKNNPNTEELDLSGCTKVTKLPKEFCKLKKLKYVSEDELHKRGGGEK